MPKRLSPSLSSRSPGIYSPHVFSKKPLESPDTVDPGCELADTSTLEDACELSGLFASVFGNYSSICEPESADTIQAAALQPPVFSSGPSSRADTFAPLEFIPSKTQYEYLSMTTDPVFEDPLSEWSNFDHLVDDHIMDEWVDPSLKPEPLQPLHINSCSLKVKVEPSITLVDRVIEPLTPPPSRPQPNATSSAYTTHFTYSSARSMQPGSWTDVEELCEISAITSKPAFGENYMPLVLVGTDCTINPAEVVGRAIWQSVHLPPAATESMPLFNRAKLDVARSLPLMPSTSLSSEQTFSREHILQRCRAEVLRALNLGDSSENTRSALDTGVIFGNLAAKRCGISHQLTPSANAITHPQLREYSEQWSSTRPRSDAFFRLSDDSGRSVSLQELSQAISIITSRPPRRINVYCAPRLPSMGSASCGKTSWSSGDSLTALSPQSPNSQLPSSEMRQMRAPSPPGAPQSERDATADPTIEVNNVAYNEIYRPRYVRGRGAAKCGWCDHCEHGGFFKIKNSGYLYHKNHEHGIFANNHVFEDPLVIRRKLERDSKWEGLCGICYRWIDLDHKERSKWGTWFRHYNNCTKEYDAIKKAVLLTGAPVEFTELEYCPYITQT